MTKKQQLTNSKENFEIICNRGWKVGRVRFSENFTINPIFINYVAKHNKMPKNPAKYAKFLLKEEFFGFYQAFLNGYVDYCGAEYAHKINEEFGELLK